VVPPVDIEVEVEVEVEVVVVVVVVVVAVVEEVEDPVPSVSTPVTSSPHAKARLASVKRLKTSNRRRTLVFMFNLWTYPARSERTWTSGPDTIGRGASDREESRFWA
jgi:hypothetical protein